MYSFLPKQWSRFFPSACKIRYLSTRATHRDPLLAWSGVGATHDMAKVFEWVLREFLLANLRGASRVDKSRISSTGKSPESSMGKTEYIFVPKGAFYEARVCSDADLRCTVLNMLERM